MDKNFLGIGEKIPIILAPMAGVSDLPFRIICNDFGCDFSYSEMVSAKGLSYNNSNTKKLLSNNGLPFGIQLFGSEPSIMSDMASSLCDTFASSEMLRVIDINMGCPAPKIVSTGSGSALMLKPSLAAEIVSAVKKKSTVPISVKLRKGFDENNINAVEFARAMESAGADIIAIHGRLRTQMYSGKADLDIISNVKAAVKIPVIGNGDIVDSASAINMLNTGCDAIMIGRGAEGNPFIFAELKAFFSGENYFPPTPKQRIEIALKHARLHTCLKGESAFVEMRKHLLWYTKSMKNGAALRQALQLCRSAEEAEAIFDSFIVL